MFDIIRVRNEPTEDGIWTEDEIWTVHANDLDHGTQIGHHRMGAQLGVDRYLMNHEPDLHEEDLDPGLALQFDLDHPEDLLMGIEQWIWNPFSNRTRSNVNSRSSLSDSMKRINKNKNGNKKKKKIIRNGGNNIKMTMPNYRYLKKLWPI